MSNAIRLVRLAPDHEGDHAVALRYGGQLAALINTDEGLPQAVRRAEGEPFISDSGFLTFTQSWCREKAAVSFAIVDGTDTAVGLISLSHINKVVGHARTGIFLSSRHAGRGIGAIAFSQLLSFARNQGVSRVGGDIPEAQSAPPAIWTSVGAVVRLDENGDTVAEIQ